MWRIKCLTEQFVLIETLWNVKKRFNETLFSLSVVLIETLWNVKY